MSAKEPIDPIVADAFGRIPRGATGMFRKTISESDVYLLAGITGDFHPNHIDAETALRNNPAGKRIAHGTLTVGLISTATSQVSEQFPSDAGFVSSGCNIQFRAPVFFGDTVEATACIAAVDESSRSIDLAVECKNQSGQVVARGTWFLRMLRPASVGTVNAIGAKA